MKSTATAMTELEKLKSRIADAAIFWVVDQECASALAALEEAVADYLEARQRRKRRPGKEWHDAE